MSVTGTLDEKQVRFFQTFGYLVLPGLLDDRIERITQEFEDILTHAANLQQHDGSKRTCLFPFIDQSEELCALLDDPRVDGVFISLLGDDYNYMGGDGNYYVGDTKWHRDGENPKYRHIKMAFYLDPVDRGSGALRVIPGSHRLSEPYALALGELIPDCRNQIGVAGAQVPALSLDSRPGDVVVFDHNLFHSSWGGSNRRRMFTINVCQRYADQDQQELADYISGAARFWVDRMHGEKMVATADSRRMRHLEQVRANDLHLAELSRQARQTMAESARG